MLAVAVPTGALGGPSPPASPQHLTIELRKTSKGRCGLSLSQGKAALKVEAVTVGSLAEEAGFEAGDVLVDIGGVPVADIRYSKIKANGLLFDARNTCAVTVLRGASGCGMASPAAARPARPTELNLKAALSETPAAIRSTPNSSARSGFSET